MDHLLKKQLEERARVGKHRPEPRPGKPIPKEEHKKQIKKRGLHLFRDGGSRVDLENLFMGLPIFLILSGPSLVTHPLHQIRLTGAYTMGVNNSWGVYKPTFWTCADDPRKFLSSGWLDPRIIKIVPRGKAKKTLRKKEGKMFRETEIQARDCPGTLFYERNLHFDPSTYLDEPTVNWGCSGKKEDALGIRGARSVMLSAVRLCYYLGFRDVYLLGCDFKMEKGRQNYAFEQDRWASSIRGNNNTYNALKARFEALKPYFEKKGFSVYNCNPESELEVFPYRSFKEGLSKFRDRVPEIEDTLGWYDVEDKVKSV